MTTSTPNQERWVLARLREVECDPRARGFFAAAKVAAAGAGLILITEFADAFAHPTALIPVLTTSALAMGLLTWLTLAAWTVLAWANSRECHVFRATRVVGWGLYVGIVGAVLAATSLAGQPFAHLTSTFRIGAADIADLALLLAAITCLSLAGTALLAAWGLWQEEHRWAETHEQAQQFRGD